MELLLFLSALLAGLTGALTGDRRVEVVQVEQSAIVKAGAAVEAVAVRVAPVRCAMPAPRSPFDEVEAAVRHWFGGVSPQRAFALDLLSVRRLE